MIDFRKLNHLFFIAEFPSCIRIESTIGILITKSKIIIFLNPEKISLKVPSTNPNEEKKNSRMNTKRRESKKLSEWQASLEIKKIVRLNLSTEIFDSNNAMIELKSEEIAITDKLTIKMEKRLRPH